MPGSRPPSSRSLMLAACFMTFSRVRLSPHCFSTCTRSCATRVAVHHRAIELGCLPGSTCPGTRRTPSCRHRPSTAGRSGPSDRRTEMMPWHSSKPAGFITPPIEAETLLRKCSGFQPISAILLDRLRREFRRGDVDEHVGAGRLQLDDVGVDGRLGGFVALLDRRSSRRPWRRGRPSGPSGSPCRSRRSGRARAILAFGFSFRMYLA